MARLGKSWEQINRLSIETQTFRGVADAPAGITSVKENVGSEKSGRLRGDIGINGGLVLTNRPMG